ncbi:ABC transporter ATP-binding protein [Danxiaibacter flavus]|uniref:ABC transporter ATP-binding protein n=1 Tax=Danxiaibacter flavus TaxID=3049108 RepID=A0ABV3ZAX3_9BACT|nr:ABC transporter ATP-binding protein [Chitinophagaceae bacterium DXS]
MKPLLSIQHLSVEFIQDGAATQALHDVSIDVCKGELVAIVGESGSGKSVTSLSVLQLLPTPPAVFTSGKIVFTEGDATIDLLKCSEDELENIRGNKIAMIFQEPMTSLNPVHTCGNQVKEAIKLHKNLTEEAAKKETIGLFRQVKLPDPEGIFTKYPHEISGGQKQRVMIAMAMSCSPTLLICDEPTTALDVTVQKSVLELIKQLQLQNNMGVIFISHDLGVISEIADRIVVMYKGRVVERGTRKQIFNNAQHPYTKALLACRPALYEKQQRLPVVSDFMEVDAEGNIFEKQFNIRGVPAISEQHQPKPEKKILDIRDLTVRFATKKTFLGKVLKYNTAVNNISCSVFEGETIGLVGESGCGKTTVGRSIAGLIKPDEGKIFFDGTDIVTASKSQWNAFRKDIQIIFQDPYSSLHPRKKIGDAIAEPLRVHNIYPTKAIRKEKVIELLEKVNLKPEHYHRYPHEFSGGQRQRIVIARALALQPRFIICDESVSALDVSVQAQVLNLLNDLKKDFGFTAIFISHDLSVVKYTSDRIFVMHKGSIIEEGNAEDLYNHPQQAYTQQLISAIPKV